MPKVLLAILAVIVAGVYAIGRGQLVGPEHAGSVNEQPRPAAELADRQQRQQQANLNSDNSQILFGDFHVHTTFSFDAYMFSLPMFNGEGAHPPADACDFARYCSALDFWSINDHAEGLSHRQWMESADAINQCNQVAGDPDNPDLVSFLGWEWSQSGNTADNHYGHKNVILRDSQRDSIPSRPIAALVRDKDGNIEQNFRGPGVWARAAMALFGGDKRYVQFNRFVDERDSQKPCKPRVPVHKQRNNCIEAVATPGELFSKLDEWGFDSMVIPHGTSWGLYTPAGSTWDKQLTNEQNDPQRQFLTEIYSGHGNTENYRSWRAAELNEHGKPSCPQPTGKFTANCWRAGEIILARCLAEDINNTECQQRASDARKNYLAAGISGHVTVPGAAIEEWLDAGQCRDCYLPSLNHRPGNSAQYQLAIRNFDDDLPKHSGFGFIGSSDVHTARPGTGYKEYDRREMTEAAGPDSAQNNMLTAPEVSPAAQSEPLNMETTPYQGYQLSQYERGASFFYTGGLVAVHTQGRDKQAIWDALQRKEVYATSGPRLLLWFNLETEDQTVPMGGEATMANNPSFEVRAMGAFEQQPGCPDFAEQALGAERLNHLCRNQCYNPGDKRHPIERIEIIRIQPQNYAGEPVEALIQDPWKTFNCPADGNGCNVRFTDTEFSHHSRDTLYYARAMQRPTATVNGGNLRCEYDENGQCVTVNPCYGDYRTDFEDECYAEKSERAWASPIFITYQAAQ